MPVTWSAALRRLTPLAHPRHAGVLRCALLLPLLGTAGCLFVHEKYSTYSGTYFNDGEVKSLSKDMTKAYVTGILGSPTRRADTSDGGQVLTYEFTEKCEETNKLFLIFKCAHDSTTSHRIHLVFDNKGKLVKWYSGEGQSWPITSSEQGPVHPLQ